MPTVEDFIDCLVAKLGAPYIFGGIGPIGYDCSGLGYTSAGEIGVVIPRSSEDQYRLLEPCQRERGAGVFFNVPSDNQAQPAHVGWVLDSNTMIQAPHTGAFVEITSPIPNNPSESIMGYRRIPQLQPPPYNPPPENPPMTTGLFVRLMYFFILHRDPDPGGYATYVNAINNGMTQEAAWTNMQDSPEGLAQTNGARNLFAANAV